MASITGLVVGVPVLVAVIGLVALRLYRPHVYAGTVMQAPTAAPAMDGLVWADGGEVDLGALAGDVVVLYFGYTSCPDVCPTTLSDLARAMDELGADAERVHVAMVTVDPARDTPTTLDAYMRSFHPSFRGITGPLEDIERVASLYGIFFARGEEYDDGSYAMDHTASVLGIDTEGHLRIVWPSGTRVDDLAADLAALL